jgi:hypothetical protein
MRDAARRHDLTHRPAPRAHTIGPRLIVRNDETGALPERSHRGVVNLVHCSRARDAG